MTTHFTIANGSDADVWDLEEHVLKQYERLTGRKAIGADVSVFPSEVFARIVLDPVEDADWTIARRIEDEIVNDNPQRPITVLPRLPSMTSKFAGRARTH